MDQVAIEVSAPGEVGSGSLALPLAEDDSTPRSNDTQLAGRLRQLADDGELKGELGRTVLLHTDGQSSARRIVVAGVGRRADVDSDAIRTAASAVVRRLRDVGGTLSWQLDDALPLSFAEQARAVAHGVTFPAAVFAGENAGPGPFAVVGPDGELLAVYERRRAAVKPAVVLAPVEAT